MTLSAPRSNSSPPDRLPRAAPPSLIPWLWRDGVLRSAFLIVGFLIGYQLAVTVLQPPWIGPVTDWLRAALAWPELVIMVGGAVWVTRTHRACCALSWWMLSLALLSYTLARNLWTVANQLIFHHGVPFPTVPDLFFVLQYPFFFLFLALILLPSLPPGGARIKVILDGLLWVGAAAALSWYFILAPMYLARWLSPPAKAVSLFYPVGDLLLLYGLVRTMLRQSPSQAERLSLYVLGAAFLCLITADAWVVLILLWHPRHVYRTGRPPDLFWLAFYLLLPLAAVVLWRLTLHEPPPLQRDRPASARTPQQLQRQDLLASLRFLAPFVAALAASAVILIHATMTAATAIGRNELAPFAVSGGLLLLGLARQEVTFLENARLQREQEAAHLEALALRESNRRMEEFLSIVSNELRTPMISLEGNIHLMSRRLQKARLDAEARPEEENGRPDELGRVVALVAMVQAVAERVERSLDRLVRLVDDLLDESRISAGRLEFRLAPTDLVAIVRTAVEEQQQNAGSRTIQWALPDDAQPVLVQADAGRIEQVVTNYLSNALKYSQEDQPITVRLEVDGATAHVSVRDAGIGVPPDEQPAIWDRFHRAAGVTIQSGSDVGIGIGLHICKTIIEAHGGQVGVASAPGQGSTFWFTLPVATAGAGANTGATPTA